METGSTKHQEENGKRRHDRDLEHSDRETNVRREKFFSLRRTHTRGHHLKIDEKRVTHQTRLRFFSQRVVNSWNGLPSKVVSAHTAQTFKVKLDKCLELP